MKQADATGELEMIDLKVSKQTSSVKTVTMNDDTSSLDTNKQFCLLINGNTISQVIKSDNSEAKKRVLDLIDKSVSIVVYRCSPDGKASIVNFVKEDKKVTCLAIGDGGNDINMIQSAHIGVGIEGNEGT